VISEWIFGQDLSTWALFVEIIIAGAIVVLSGSQLSIQADRVADRYHLGGAWIGVLLLATVTSLPEVVTGCTAVWLDRADLAFAAIFGSCSFNIVLIVLFNYFVGGGSILTGKGTAHTLTSSFGIVLLSLAIVGILLTDRFAGTGAAPVSELIIAALIGFTYVFCMRLIHRNNADPSCADTDAQVDPEQAASPDSQADALWPRLVIASAVLVTAAWWLARTGDVLADHPIKMLGRPLGATFVGSLFLAIATSLPEIVTGLTAVKLGNLDMALGNIFGSNMFNIFIVPMLKITSLAKGQPLLMGGEHFSLHDNLTAAILPVLLTGVVVGGLSYRSRRRVLKRFGIDSALIAAIYVAGMILLFT